MTACNKRKCSFASTCMEIFLKIPNPFFLKKLLEVSPCIFNSSFQKPLVSPYTLHFGAFLTPKTRSDAQDALQLTTNLRTEIFTKNDKCTHQLLINIPERKKSYYTNRFLYTSSFLSKSSIMNVSHTLPNTCSCQVYLLVCNHRLIFSNRCVSVNVCNYKILFQFSCVRQRTTNCFGNLSSLAKQLY